VVFKYVRDGTVASWDGELAISQKERQGDYMGQ